MANIVDPAFYGVFIGSTLFAQACLFQYFGWYGGICEHHSFVSCLSCTAYDLLKKYVVNQSRLLINFEIDSYRNENLNIIEIFKSRLLAK